MKKMKDNGTKITRRNFFQVFWKGLGILAGLELAGMISAYLISGKNRNDNVVRELLEAGPVNSFGNGTVTAFPGGRFYLARMSDGGFIALSLRCTHLGCAVIWEEEKKRFICPCHSSAFDISGEVLNPPANRPLDFYPVFIENGIVKVDLSSLKNRSISNKEQMIYAS